MYTSPLPTRFSGPSIKASPKKTAAKLKSMARLVANSIPNFTKEEDKRFYSRLCGATEMQRVTSYEEVGQMTKAKT